MSRTLDLLRQAIKTSDKTRYRLSKETGVGEPQLCRLMAGRENVGYDNLDLLLGAMELEVALRPKATKKRS